jgi:hypothetical protein
MSGLRHAFISTGFATALVACVVPAGATVYFENTGTTTGWSYVTREHNGTVTEVSSPVFKGSTAVRCVQVYDAAHGDTTLHSELGIRNVGQIGQERYYGWAIRIPSGQSTGGTISQIATDACSSGRQTEMMVITGTGVIDLKTKHGTACSPTTGRYNITSFMTKDVWHRIVIRKRWRDDNTAVTQVWYDGTMALDRSGVSNSITGSGLTYRWSIGNYAGFSGTIDGETRSMLVDHARVASSYAEADPAAWPAPAVTPTPTPTPPPGGGSTKYEAESLTVTASSGDTSTINGDGGSAGQYFMYNSNAVGDSVRFRIPNVAPGSYTLTIGFKKYTSRGIVQAVVGAEGGTLGNLGSPIDMYGTTAFTSVNAGTWSIGTTGHKSVELRVTGRNAASSSYTIAVDYITLTRQ